MLATLGFPADGARTRTAKTGRWVLILLVTTLLAGACTDDGKKEAEPEDRLYIAVGASETVGQGADDPANQAWTQVFFRTALPRGYRFVNLGISGATTARALAEEVPPAVEQEPDLVTVWLNVNDIRAGVGPSAYETQLRDLVRRLRRDGKTEVLVANTPPLDILPVTRGFGALANIIVSQYNEVIARVVKEEGAHLVDLYAAGVAARDRGEAAQLISRDGFHPSTAGHATVAAEFAKVYAEVAKTR